MWDFFANTTAKIVHNTFHMSQSNQIIACKNWPSYTNQIQPNIYVCTISMLTYILQTSHCRGWGWLWRRSSRSSRWCRKVSHWSAGTHLQTQTSIRTRRTKRKATSVCEMGPNKWRRLTLRQLKRRNVQMEILIHSACPQSRGVVVIVFAHVAVHRTVPNFQNLPKQNRFQEKTMFTTGETVGMAERIIDDTWIQKFFFAKPWKIWNSNLSKKSMAQVMHVHFLSTSFLTHQATAE